MSENEIGHTQTIVELTTQEIISRIVNGKYNIGSKLPNEFELIDELGVSRTSLREAIKVLCTMGVLEIRRGDGTYICSQVNPSIFDNTIYSLLTLTSNHHELYEFRFMLDSLTLRTAIKKITEPEIKELEKNWQEMCDAFKTKEFDKYRDIDFKFHMLLIDFCKNSFFTRVAKGIYTIYVKSMSQNLEKENIDNKAIHYHAMMIECLKNRQYQNVDNIVEESLTSWKNIIVDNSNNN